MPARCRMQRWHVGHKPNHSGCIVAQVHRLLGSCGSGWLDRQFKGCQDAAKSMAGRVDPRDPRLLLAGCACLQQSALTTMVVFQLDVSRSQGMFCSLIRSNQMSVKLQSVTTK